MARTMLLRAVAGLAWIMVTIAALPMAAAGQAPAGSAGNADNGKRLYMKETCYFCHGTAGQGSVAGPRLAVIARNADGFIRYVRRPIGAMPAFTDKILSDQELTDILAFLKTLPAAKPVKDIPLLDRLKGQ